MENNTTDISGEVTSPVYSERFEYKLEIIPPYSIIQCRKATIIERNGVEVGRSYHRHICNPGDDVSNECTELKRCAAVLWTPEVVAAYEASVQEPVVLPAPDEEIDSGFGVEPDESSELE